MQPKNLLKKNSVAVVEGRKEVTKVVGTPFRWLTSILCRHEAGSLLKLAELGFTSAPRLICSTGSSLTMEKIEGRSLSDHQLVDEHLFLRVMDVVGRLHHLGFAHGNLRPGNILITDRNEPVLIDFETCLQRTNPLFPLVKFSDRVRLHLLWQSRVVRSNEDPVRELFPRHVVIAMLIITPLSRFSAFLKSVKVRLRRSSGTSARQ